MTNAKHAPPKTLPSYKQALAIIEQIPRADLNVSRIDLAFALNRVLAKSIQSTIASPRFSNSAMDGYAFAFDSYKSGWPLKIFGTVYAGADPASCPGFQQNCCVKIMTGAPVPDWADSVIPIEKTSLTGDEVQFHDPEPMSHIRHQGEDIKKGATLFESGHFLEAESLMVLANFGVSQVDIHALPQVGVFTTGDELTDPGQPLKPGAIFNSSKTFLPASLKRHYGIDCSVVQTLADDPQRCFAVLSEFLRTNQPQLVLTTGAVSAGEKDFIPQLARDLGFEAKLHNVAVRPGKPIFLATRDNKVWLGLPGNPISTVTGWHFFVRPLLQVWAGLPHKGRIKASLISDIEKPAGLTCFYRGRLENGLVKGLSGQGSARLLASTRANAYIVLSESDSIVYSGNIIDVQII